MKKPHLTIATQSGFTLVELMVTLVVSSLIAAALYSTYIVQQRSYQTQSVVNEMQQNVRVALDFLVLDLRMAGYDPQSTGVGGITAANGTTISFTADMDEDGVIGTPATENEYFGYQLANRVESGVTIPTLQRPATLNAGASWQPMADYIEQIEFFYMFENGTAATLTPGAGDLDDIRSVKVSIIARAAKPDNKYTNSDTYTLASGANWTAPGDNFRRRLIVTQVDLRNMGLD